MKRKVSIRREEERERWSVSDSGERNVIGERGLFGYWVLDIGLFDALVKIVEM